MLQGDGRQKSTGWVITYCEILEILSYESPECWHKWVTGETLKQLELTLWDKSFFKCSWSPLICAGWLGLFENYQPVPFISIGFCNSLFPPPFNPLTNFFEVNSVSCKLTTCVLINTLIAWSSASSAACSHLHRQQLPQSALFNRMPPHPLPPLTFIPCSDKDVLPNDHSFCVGAIGYTLHAGTMTATWLANFIFCSGTAVKGRSPCSSHISKSNSCTPTLLPCLNKKMDHLPWFHTTISININPTRKSQLAWLGERVFWLNQS